MRDAPPQITTSMGQPPDAPASQVGSDPWRHAAQPIATTAAAGVVLVGVFAPWLRSGATTRSSFDLLDLAERLGFAEDGLFAWAVRFWPLVPLLVVAAAVAMWVQRPTVGGSLAVVGGLYVGGVAAGVSFAPDAGLIRTEWGVPLAAVGGVWLLVTGVWALVSARRR